MCLLILVASLHVSSWLDNWVGGVTPIDIYKVQNCDHVQDLDCNVWPLTEQPFESWLLTVWLLTLLSVSRMLWSWMQAATNYSHGTWLQGLGHIRVTPLVHRQGQKWSIMPVSHWKSHETHYRCNCMEVDLLFNTIVHKIKCTFQDRWTQQTETGSLALREEQAANWLQVSRESVDSLCRDGADALTHSIHTASDQKLAAYKRVTVRK